MKMLANPDGYGKTQFVTMRIPPGLDIVRNPDDVKLWGQQLQETGKTVYRKGKNKETIHKLLVHTYEALDAGEMIHPQALDLDEEESASAYESNEDDDAEAGVAEDGEWDGASE